MKWLIVPLIAGKPWNGATIHTESLGGSESSVAYTARALAKAGELVDVITHGAAGTFEGVTYHAHTQAPYVTAQAYDVVIVSRWLDALNGVPWNSKATFFWSHDLPQPGEFRLTAHKIVFLSEYHRKTWPVPDDAVEIIGDGVDLGLFQNGGDHDRDANRLVWVSNPDRGLPIAAHIFQQVRKRWPDLELHVFGRSAVYGWSDEVEAPFLPRLSDMENVFMHPPLARYALAAELRKAWAVFYPTHWPETYCMATLEAQASGTPVIAPPIAALPETVKGGVLTYDFLNAISQLRNKRRWERLSKLGIEWATENTWDIRARQWIELAERIINAQDNIVH